MKTKRLGLSELHVAPLGIGCWAFGGGDYWGPQDQRDVDIVVHQAIDAGLNFFDTAEVYNAGESERSLGAALKGRRHQAIIGSKFTPNHARKTDLRHALEQTLTRLDTDYLDLYMLHWPLNGPSMEHFAASGDGTNTADSAPRLAEVVDTLESLIKEGKIRAIGVSNHGKNQLAELKAAGCVPAANELIYSLVSRGIEAEVLPICQENHIGVIGYMPLHQGLLTGKYRSVDELPAKFARTRHFHASRSPESRHKGEGAEGLLFETLGEIRKTAQELGVDMGTLSLAWAMARDGMAVTTVGCRNQTQLSKNLEALSMHLSENTRRHLDELTHPLWARLGDNPDYFEAPGRYRVD